MLTNNNPLREDALIRRTRMIVVVMSLLTALSTVTADDLMPAFPGATGFGANTRGGRRGQVIKVTTLKPFGPGSLNEACQIPGPRIVVFEVSGIIRGDIVITQPFLTIAGQTAPGMGITIEEYLNVVAAKLLEAAEQPPSEVD
jgi:hypothetical protein